MRQTNPDDSMQNLFKVGKRIALTVLITAVVLVGVAYLLRHVITQNWLQILLFTIVFGVVVLIEEVIARKREKAKQQRRLEDRDVFK